MKIFSVSRPLRFASGPLLLLALNGGGFPPQQASQPPQYIEKSYPVPAGNELPDKNAQMQMHEKEASRKDFEAANAERRRQIERDSEELVRLARELKATLENGEASSEEIQAGITKLGESSQKMGAAMYAAAEADQSAAGGSDGSTGESDDDVVDAEIIDEDTPGHAGSEGDGR